MKNRLAELLREARKARGETQAAVADRLGMSQQLLSRIERGEASLEKILGLCRGLGLEVTLCLGRRAMTLVHPIDPDERREIEANIAWFSRLKPEERLRTAARNLRAAQRLIEGARRGR